MPNLQTTTNPKTTLFYIFNLQQQQDYEMKSRSYFSLLLSNPKQYDFEFPFVIDI